MMTQIKGKKKNTDFFFLFPLRKPLTITVIFIFLILFNFTILYWFCHISKWICHRYTCVPHPEPSSLLPIHVFYYRWAGSSILRARRWTAEHASFLWSPLPCPGPAFLQEALRPIRELPRLQGGVQFPGQLPSHVRDWSLKDKGAQWINDCD